MRTQNKPRHQSAVTREDFCCGFWVIFGRRLVFVLVLSMGTGATDADGSAVATGSRRQTKKRQRRASTRGPFGYAARHGTTATPARRGGSSAERSRRQTEEGQRRASTRGSSGYTAWDGTTTAAPRGTSSTERSRRQTEESQGRTSTPRRSCYAA